MGKVFISYSHDSPEHSERVLTLANALRAMGVDIELDRYHVRPPHGWPHWCEEQLRPEVSSFVLVVCTPIYRARVEARVSADEGRGVYWEGAILYSYIYNAKGNARFIPILLDDAPEMGVPLPLDGHTRYRLKGCALADPGFAALYRELTEQPATAKPELGAVVQMDRAGAAPVAAALPVKPAVTEFAGGDDTDGGGSGADASSSTEAGEVEAATAHSRFWSPFSDEESVARGEVRFWAIVETIVAMAVFWWVAIRYETFVLLTTSLFIAPLLLLRSEESTRLGVKWFDDGMFPTRWPDDPEERKTATKQFENRWIRIGAVIGLVVGFGLGYPAAKLFLVGHTGWTSFGRGLLSELAVSWVSVSVSVSISGAVAGAGAVAVAGAGAVAGAAAVAVAVAVAGAGAVAVAVALALAVFHAPGYLTGVWLATLLIRLGATTRHGGSGYQNMPTNARRLALCMAPLQQPELLPGLPEDHEFRFYHFFSRAAKDFRSSDIIDKAYVFSTFVVGPFIFLPAWAYRFILKSTLWFWWILFIVGGAPRLDGGIDGLRADAYRKATAWIGIATTIFAIVGFGFGWLLKPYAENLSDHAPLPAAVALLVLVDWKSVPFVQWVTLASASMTIAVIIWTRDIVVDSINPLRAGKVAAQLPWLGHLVKWKSGFGAVAIALLMLYIALYANAVQHWLPVSDWAAGWLHSLYGTAAERLRG